MSERTKIHHGPNGWTLVADRREVFPEDPGNGTPLMVYAPRMAGSGTLGRVLDTGEIDDTRCALMEVPASVMTWLDEVADTAETWLDGE